MTALEEKEEQQMLAEAASERQETAPHSTSRTQPRKARVLSEDLLCAPVTQITNQQVGL